MRALASRWTANSLASLPQSDREAFLSSLTKSEKEELFYRWPFWARSNQLPSADDWHNWFLIAGRGFGKTRTGAEWVRAQAEAGVCRRIALVGRTASDVRQVMVEGESGILATSPPWFRPHYQPSRRQLRWPNGVIATTYTADKPDQLRGPQHHCAWADELASWRFPESWDQLQFGLRLGENPQTVITTTPRPTPIIRELLKAPHTRVTRGTTYDNRANLPEKYFSAIVAKYEGTRLGRQELRAEILDDNPLALWKRTQLDELRIKREDLPTFRRVVISVDPTVHDGETDEIQSDTLAECGIIAIGLGDINGEPIAVIMDDLSCFESPAGWAKEVIRGYRKYRADRVIAEINQGGKMVEMVIRAVDKKVSYRGVHATKGKYIRAEPVAALYEQGRVRHCGTFAELEDQMCEWIPGSPSPDRMDALVWGITDLMLTGKDARGWAIS